MVVETDGVAEIPITPGKVIKIQETSDDLLRQAQVLETALCGVRTRGSLAIVGWHGSILQRSGIFFRDLGEDLKFGKSVEVTGTYDKLDSPDRRVMGVRYHLSTGIYDSAPDRLDDNALHEVLNLDMNPNMWIRSEEHVDLYQLLKPFGKVFLTPSDLVGI